VRDKPTHTQPESAARGRLPATHTGALAVCGHGAYMPKLEKGGPHWWVNAHIQGAHRRDRHNTLVYEPDSYTFDEEQPRHGQFDDNNIKISLRTQGPTFTT
jgi:hypothetical protein